jgi:probable rRNA maturation factor
MSREISRHEQRSGEFEIALVNEQSRHTVDEERLCAAAGAVFADSQFSSAAISIAVVGDEKIHELNRRFLQHDWPTDVLSFVLLDGEEHLEGEIILSADTAARESAVAEWPEVAEQLLYVVHGALHLIGYDDKSPDKAAKMRAAEVKYLREFGFEHRPAADGEIAGELPSVIQTRGGATAR